MAGQEVPLLKLLEGLKCDIDWFIAAEKLHPHHLHQSEVTALEEKLKTLKIEHDELKKEADDFDKKTSSSRDARKMYGDITPGDTTHHDVQLSYRNYSKTANRMLPKELNMKEETSEGKFKVWRMISEIIQESFSKNRSAIIGKIKANLKEKLEANLPASAALDEATCDLLRAFHMYVQESGQLEKVTEKLKKTHEGAGSIAKIDEAAAIISQIDPQYYYSFYHDKDKAHGLVATTEGSSSASASLPRTRVEDKKKKKEKTNDSQTSINNKQVNAKLTESPCSVFVDKKKKFSMSRGQSLDCSSNQLPPNEIQAVMPEEYDESIHKFEEKLKVFMERLASLKEIILKKRQLKSEIKKLEHHKEIKKKRTGLEHDEPPHYKDYVPNADTEKGTLQKWHEEIVKGLLDQLEQDFLHGLLDCSSDVVIDGGADTREKYKIYGLLLSACSMGKANPAAEGVAKELFDHVIDVYKVTEVGGIVMKYVEEAVDLTYNMLTLLPPLVVTVCPQKYKEEVHDINSSTWDEFAVSDSDTKLIYYRPILVYGNQLSVAVKGLVGNVEMKQIGNKTAHQMPQKEKKVEQRTNHATQHYSHVSEFDPLANNSHISEQGRGFFKCFACKESCNQQNAFSVGKYYVHHHCNKCVISNCTRTDLQLFHERIVCTGHIYCPNCHQSGCMVFNGGYYYCQCCKNNFSAN